MLLTSLTAILDDDGQTTFTGDVELEGDYMDMPMQDDNEGLYNDNQDLYDDNTTGGVGNDGYLDVDVGAGVNDEDDY
eukprot:m.320217 g.320217  ORF g.320217 m.320217 type:complete len:77 (+) comp16450_c0_seq1:1338-1568(+)